MNKATDETSCFNLVHQLVQQKLAGQRGSNSAIPARMILTPPVLRLRPVYEN
jgi:hypothetical protein